MMLVMVRKTIMRWILGARHASQTSRMTRKLTMRMIREGMGHALAVSDTRNGTARNEMEMNMK